MPHVTFVTSSNLAVNPRCVKEVQLAVANGFEVAVVKFVYNDWSRQLDEQIMSGLPAVDFYNISVGKEPFGSWLFSSLVQRLARLVSLFDARPGFTGYGFDRRSWLLQDRLQQIKGKTDWVVAHNPAAFLPAYCYAKKKQAKFGVDVEDYHPGEFGTPKMRQQMEVLMRHALGFADYVSFASPMIADRTMADVPAIRKSVVVNNCFSRTAFVSPLRADEGKLQLVWFSQHIDFGRGLEKVIPVLAEFVEQVQLTLVGNLRPGFATYLDGYSDLVKHIKPLPQNQLHELIAGFDVGLCIEDKDADENRSLCLTNKIWSFFQAGAYILASDTAAQSRFLLEHAGCGMLCDINDSTSVRGSVQMLLSAKVNLRKQGYARFEAAKRYSWEVEKQKLLTVWNL